VLYRVAQEALASVVKHARASSARVELLERGGSVVLIHDGVAHAFAPKTGLQARTGS
jgi:glucose-6-phosphate-specific signal transduction histidine kinase